ncbi:hypothetical protein ACFQH2_19710 [Natronoarchaeum sp. GCM10025703]|uniref:hypothetical protein n=1 Tax=Natronoarchaeum sp. GCM10025703 TaxID=3252685 RepID=UPI00362145B7
MLQVKTKEFFAVRAPDIVNAKNQAEREELIENLESEQPELYEEYNRNVKRTNQTAEFVRHSGRYPLTGSGEINIYAPFAEHFLNSINDSGRSGVIVPTGIATESKTQEFFREIVEENNLVSLYGFVNSNSIFEGVDSRQRFCLLSLSEEEVRESRSAEFAFYLTELEQLQNKSRIFELTPREIETINPNTKTCPIFTNRKDAELTLKIHNNSDILINESEEIHSPWDVDISYMYHMSSDSGLFNSKEDLENEGWDLQENLFEKNDEYMLPLYEAKLFHQYDHRFASFEGLSKEDIQNGNPRRLNEEEKHQSGKNILPRYWVNEESYQDVNGDEWHLALRRYARSDDRRTTIATILPKVAAGDSVNLIRGINEESGVKLLAILNSFTLDYVMRQKHGGAAISQYLLKQLPIPEPSRFEEVQINGISASKRLKELVFKYMYPSRELEPFVRKVDEKYVEELQQSCEDRRKVRAEIEAIICEIYNLNKSDVKEIFESFEQIKSNEIGKYDEFKTRKEVLTAFEAISSGSDEVTR